MTKEEAKKELSKYVYNVLQNIMQFGMPMDTGIEAASNKVAEACMKIAEESGSYQTIDDCVKRAREIAKNYDCKVDINVVYHD